MRTLTPTLLAAKQATTIAPRVRAVLTLPGQPTFTYDRRILDIDHQEHPYSHHCELVLDNTDNALTHINLKGYQAQISYGALTTAGEEFSPTAPLWVLAQRLDSAPGKLRCTLLLRGIPDLLALDEASATFIPTSSDTRSVRTLINEILGTPAPSLLPQFSHCRAWEAVWVAGFDPLADTFQPRDAFRINAGGSRLAAIRRLLDYTRNVARFGADGRIHILRPVVTGTTFDYQYSLLTGGHTFFSKATRQRLVLPSRIVVRSQPDDTPQFSGEATDAPSHAVLPTTEFHQGRLTSNAQAADVATAILSKYQLWSDAGDATVPMNVGAELYDFVRVIDQRQTDDRTGTIGCLHRSYNVIKTKDWSLSFSFGDHPTMLRPRERLRELATTGGVGTRDFPFERLSPADLLARGLQARNMGFVWITPGNNINLAAIGDTLDNLPDGVTWRRTRVAALSPDGLVLLDQTIAGTHGHVLATALSAGRALLSETVQSPGFRTVNDHQVVSWDGREVRVHRATTPPADRGIFWWDTARNIMLWFNPAANVWQEHTGEWYRKTGVGIHAGRGIGIFGGSGLMGLRTFPTETDYVHNTNIQCQVDTAGRISAGAGNVLLHRGGLYLVGSTARFVTAAAAGVFHHRGILGHSASGVNITALDPRILILEASGGHVTFTTHRIESSGVAFVELPRTTNFPTWARGRFYFSLTDDFLTYARVATGTWRGT